MSEEDMAPGKSSVAVNNCIRQLSYHKHNLDDTAGIWGEVRAFYWRMLTVPVSSSLMLEKAVNLLRVLMDPLDQYSVFT